MSRGASLGMVGFAIEPSAGGVRPTTLPSGANGEKGSSNSAGGEFELALNAVQGLMPLVQDTAGRGQSAPATPVDTPISVEVPATVAVPTDIGDPTALALNLAEVLPNLAFPAAAGAVPVQTNALPVPNLLAQESIRARIVYSTAEVLSPAVAAPVPDAAAVPVPGAPTREVTNEEADVQLRKAVQGIPLQSAMEPVERPRLVREDNNAQRTLDVPKVEIAAVSTETHRREVPVRERATAIVGRDGTHTSLADRPLTPVGIVGFEPGKSPGHTGSDTPGKGTSDSFSNAVSMSQLDQEGLDPDSTLTSVRTLDVPTLSKVVVEAADQLRSEAPALVYRTPSVIAPNAPAFVKSLSFEVQSDQGQSVRLRLSMHEDGLEVSLASADPSVMSMLSSERDQLMSTLNAVGHNVVSVRVDAVERPGAASLAQGSDFGDASGRAAGDQPQGDGGYRNHPERRQDQERLKATREGDRSGLYV